MENNPPTTLMQMAHLFQMELFPRVQAVVGELSSQAQLLVKASVLVPWDKFLCRNRIGRPAEDRKAMQIAFLAKAIYNLPTTRQLLDRLHNDSQLRHLCGWQHAEQIPSESTFSRAFAELAANRTVEHLHRALIELRASDRLIGHIARDSTAIEARERFPGPSGRRKENQSDDPPAHKAKKSRKKQPRGRFARAKAQDRGTEIEKQRKMKLSQMLARLPNQCAIGVKTSSKGHQRYWVGYKLHLDVADGEIPISAILTGANVHDSQVAIPLMTMTEQRVPYLYDVMDSAYDAEAILAHSRARGRVPVVAPHPRRGTKKPSAVPKVRPPKFAPEMDPAKQIRYAERTMSERVNGRLKDNFGGRYIWVRGPLKVMTHLMFGLLAMTVDQLIKRLNII
jgi:hypothetical protein